MLLRSITKHVREQNWFAVFLDFFIVVAGILIAFQITNWNEARQNKASERNYLERLQRDIDTLSEQRWLYDFLRPTTNDILEQLTEFFDGDVPDLSEAENIIQTAVVNEHLSPRRLKSMICNALDWSSSLSIPPSDLPTATELVSSGHLERIQSREIRAAILSYMQQVSRSENYINGRATSTLLISREFPEYIKIRYPNEKIEQGDENPEFICDYDAMREDNRFVNAVNKNREAYKDYTEQGVLPVGEKLRELQMLIDEELK